MKFIFIMFFVFMHSYCANAVEISNYSLRFETSLNTFMNGFNKEEGIVDNVLLIDFRKKTADEYFDSVIDRINQMWKDDMLNTKEVLKDIKVMFVYSKKYNPLPPYEEDILSESTRLNMERFLPYFESVILIDPTQICDQDSDIQESNLHLKKTLKYLKECLKKRYDDISVNWKKLGIKNAKAYLWA